MRIHRRAPGRPRLALLLAPVALVALLLAGCLPPPPPPPPAPVVPAGETSIMGPSRLTADQLVAYYRSHVSPSNTYRATGATLEQLAALFVTEGNRYNVRGDVAFAQSILETGWFHFPDGGIVRPDNNNFAGIGACDTCGNGYQFSSAQAGVRAQIQLLRNYADAASRTTTIPDAPVPELWGLDPANAAYNFDHYFAKGRAPAWEDLGNGNWAMSPDYSTIILQIYDAMLTSSGVSGAGVSSADVGATGVDGEIVLPQVHHVDVGADMPRPR